MDSIVTGTTSAFKVGWPAAYEAVATASLIDQLALKVSNAKSRNATEHDVQALIGYRVSMRKDEAVQRF